METDQIYHFFDQGLVDVSNQQYPLTAEEVFYTIATRQDQ